MSKKAITTDLTLKEQKLEALYICSDLLGQAIECMGYACHEDLQAEYTEMANAVYAYSDKLSALIKPLKAMKQG